MRGFPISKLVLAYAYSATKTYGSLLHKFLKLTSEAID